MPYAVYYPIAHKKSRIFRCGFFYCSLKANYFAGASAGAAAGAAASAFFAFFAFFAFLAGFFTSFFISAAGAAASAGAAAGLAASLAKTTAEKERATRAATIVDRTFFIVYYLQRECVWSVYSIRRANGNNNVTCCFKYIIRKPLFQPPAVATSYTTCNTSYEANTLKYIKDKIPGYCTARCLAAAKCHTAFVSLQ